ncbi:MAG: aldehyde dehydrogenase family protein, partial [Micrococcales bacterium]|nr:aldehyde dehydrogenase family protein [Micrococcales bacterium]
DVPPDALCAREETFGPVVEVYPVADDDEAVAAINDSVYGLSAGVWTSDERRGWAIARRLRAGGVAVNEAYVATWAPIGAPQNGWNASGLGARHGREALLASTRPQTIALQHAVHGLVGRHGPGLGLDRVFFGRGAQTWTAWYSPLLRALKALRVP